MMSDLIKQYFEAGNLQGLISLFEALRDQRDRAEAEVRSHVHQIKLLAQKFSNITEPATGQRVAGRSHDIRQNHGPSALQVAKPSKRTARPLLDL